MKYIYKFLSNYRPKHNLDYDLELKDLSKDGDLSVHFTIYNKESSNKSINLYTFQDIRTTAKKVDTIRKILRSKKLALDFINGDYEWVF